MKTFKQFLTEAIIDVSKESKYIETAIKRLKPEFVGKDLNYYEVEEILNNDVTLRSFGILFTQSDRHFDEFDSSNAMINIGLDGARYYPGLDEIHVQTLRGIEDKLSDSYDYDDFVNIFMSSIKHELVHRNQMQRTREEQFKDQDGDNIEKYLGDHREIMAYSAQAAHELMVTSGELPEKLINKLRTSQGIRQIVPWSDALGIYHDTFEHDSPIWKKFIKYLIAYLEGHHETK